MTDGSRASAVLLSIKVFVPREHSRSEWSTDQQIIFTLRLLPFSISTRLSLLTLLSSLLSVVFL